MAKNVNLGYNEYETQLNAMQDLSRAYNFTLKEVL